MKNRILWALALAAWLATGCGEKPKQLDDDDTRAVMREIFEGIRVALPASIDSATFSEPQNQGEIFAALDTMARNAAVLEEHAKGCDAQTGFLARSVKRDAIEARTTYRYGHYQRSAFVLQQMVEDCVACHTRLPADCGSSIAVDFVDEGVMASLPARSKAPLLIATRQFDRALGALEEVLADPATHPAMMLGPLTDYLIVALRVEGDYQRPVATLKTFARRKDLWPSLRRDVEEWIATITSLRERAARASSVDDARAIIEEGEALDEYGNGQGSLLHFIVASSILERYIHAHPVRNDALGEAYYLRGILETRIGGNYWVTTAPFFLEESIRIAPHAASATEALVVLERELFAAYEGSDIEELPDAEKAHLAELRALIEGS